MGGGCSESQDIVGGLGGIYMVPLYITPIFSPISPQHAKDRVISKIDGTFLLSLADLQAGTVKPDPKDLLVLLVGSGGTENIVKDLVANGQVTSPIRLLTYDESNSLPAALETRAYLRSIGLECQITHRTLESLSSVVTDWSRYLEVVNQVENTRLGILGEPSEWLIASHVDKDEVRSRWGLQLVELEMNDLSPNNKSSDDSLLAGLTQSAQSSLVPSTELGKADALANQLQEVVKKHQLQGFTIRCFDLLQGHDVSACLALSELNNQGVVAGCEGDVPAAFTMLLVRLLTGEPSFMANLTHYNSENNTLNLAHCTVPTTMLDGYSLMTHFETDRSVAVKGQFQTKQPVTILKVWGRALDKWIIRKGILVENLTSEKACRTQVVVRLVNESVEDFMDEALANHHILVRGDHVQELNNFLRFVLH